MTRELRVALIKELQGIRERTEVMLELLLPDGEDAACSHPSDRAVDLSTMGEPLYRCGVCGVEQAVPFHTSVGG